MFKANCASCGEPIQNSPQYYKVYGNYCKSCNAKCGVLSEVRLRIRRLNDPLVINHPAKLKRTKASLVQLVQELKRWDLDLDYVLKSQGEVDKLNILLQR